MSNLVKLQTDYIRFMSSLLRDGFLGIRFLEWQKLKNESRVKVVSLFFEEAEENLNNLTMSLQQQVVDFKKLYNEIDQFKNYSFSIGVQRVKDALNIFRNVCLMKNLDECMECLQLAKDEYFLVKNKFETLFRLERQIVAAGGSIPIIS